MSVASKVASEINRSYLLSHYREAVRFWAYNLSLKLAPLDTNACVRIGKRRWAAYLHLLAAEAPPKDLKVIHFLDLIRDMHTIPDIVERIDLYFFHLTKRSPYSLLVDVCCALTPCKPQVVFSLSTDSVAFTRPFDICAAAEELLQFECTGDVPEFYASKIHTDVHRFPCVCREGIRPENISMLSLNPTLIPAVIYYDDHKACGIPDTQFAALCTEESRIHEPPSASSSSSDAWKVFEGTAFAQNPKPIRVIPVVLPVFATTRQDVPAEFPRPKPVQSVFDTPERPPGSPVTPDAPKRKRSDTPRPESPCYNPGSPIYIPTPPLPPPEGEEMPPIHTLTHESDTEVDLPPLAELLARAIPRFSSLQVHQKVDHNLASALNCAPMEDEATMKAIVAPESDDDEEEEEPIVKQTPPTVSLATLTPPRKMAASPARVPRKMLSSGAARKPASESDDDEEEPIVKHIPPTVSLATLTPPRKMLASGAAHKPTEDVKEEKKVWTYEKILAATKTKSRVLFLVQWKGFPLEEATFEPASCFSVDGSKRSFEVALLRNLFRAYNYKFLPHDQCIYSSGWKVGNVASQMSGDKNVFKLRHFEFSYWSLDEVIFKVCDPSVWHPSFHGTPLQIKFHMPLWAYTAINRQADKEQKEDEEYRPPHIPKRRRI